MTYWILYSIGAVLWIGYAQHRADVDYSEGRNNTPWDTPGAFPGCLVWPILVLGTLAYRWFHREIIRRERQLKEQEEVDRILKKEFDV